MTSELDEIDRQLATLRRTLMCLKSGSPGLSGQLNDRLRQLMYRREEIATAKISPSASSS